MVTRETILEKLRPIEDPEIGLSIVDLGLIYDIEIVDNRTVNITMTLTTPACPYGPILLTKVQDTIREIDGVEKATVAMVWEPPWNPAEMASEKARDELGIWWQKLYCILPPLLAKKIYECYFGLKSAEVTLEANSNKNNQDAQNKIIKKLQNNFPFAKIR